MQEPDKGTGQATARDTSGSLYLTPQGTMRGMAPVARVFEVIGSIMQRERGRLNMLDSFGGQGTYGDRLARAFTQAGLAVRRAGTGDAGRDLELAGEAIETVAGGQTGRYYRQGLRQAAQAVRGRPGLSVADAGRFLSAFLEGVRQNNPAQPGQSTMLDVLIPAASAYATSSRLGLTRAQAIQSAVGAAAMGRKQTASMPPLVGGKGRAGHEDPGAAGAELFVDGLMRGLLGGDPVAQIPGPVDIELGALAGGSGGPDFDILPTGFLTGGAEGMDTDLAVLLSSVDANISDPGGRDQTDYAK
jgi:dihydroxyacetone kinase-like protein